MIFVELAEQLKKAGFPQSGAGCTQSPETEAGKSVYQPTLEELIGGCGEEFESLSYGRNRERKWKATGGGGLFKLGSNPHEAVAELWLSMHIFQGLK